MRPSRALDGVERLDLKTNLKVPGRPPVQRSVNERTFKGVVPCPNGCHEGGYDLSTALLGAGVAKQRPNVTGAARCKGFVGGTGARKPCPGVMELSATVSYSFGW